MKKYILFLLMAAMPILGSGNIRLPRIISDNMVLQQNKPIKVWGWADKGEKVTVVFKGQSKSVKTDKSGKWIVVLAPEPAGGPFQLIIKGKNSITLSDVLIGEVWVCSGQSNMEWTVRNTKNAEEEVRNGNYPQIRQFLVQKSVSLKPEEDVKGGDWKACSSESIADFTAVGYFFARDLYNELKVPIGLINTSWGGTHSETWTSKEAFEQSEEFKSMIATMPAIDLEALAKQRRDDHMKKLKEMNINLSSVDATSWKTTSYDDTQWHSLNAPGLWEEQGFDEVDGVIWYRKTISISGGDAGKEAVLELAMIDDSDETFINGIKVGQTINRYNEKRKYNVPAGVLVEGRNLIAVKVEDTGGGGGIYGEKSDLKLTTNSHDIIALDGKWQFNIETLSSGTTSIGPNAYPTLLFNAMVNPILNFAIEGAIWYQGESNAGRAYQYRKAFPLMIQDWRNHWKQGDFPFYFVQLASFHANYGTSEHGSSWAELREAQSMTLSLPNTGMAVTTDIGEANDIHPRNKQDVGKRLAAVALNKTYGRNNVFSGPVYKGINVEGKKIRVSFTNVGGGLMVNDKYGYLKGFEVAGSDQKFRYAKAWLEGNDVVVSCDEISNPVAVRFAWADNPEDANLFNKEGFPASPFRSDSWQGITVAGKFAIEK
jgi:sialate O-acetylesterase